MAPGVVFLDIDGVLNSTKWWYDREQIEYVDHQIDPRAVALLNKLAPRDARVIVVSSTWRLMGYDNVRENLQRVGVEAEIVGVTPDLWGVRLDGTVVGDYRRGLEIQSWLLENPEYGSYVVIDDDFDAGLGHGDRFIRTSNKVGLTEDDVERACEIFRRDLEAREQKSWTSASTSGSRPTSASPAPSASASGRSDG